MLDYSSEHPKGGRRDWDRETLSKAAHPPAIKSLTVANECNYCDAGRVVSPNSLTTWTRSSRCDSPARVGESTRKGLTLPGHLPLTDYPACEGGSCSGGRAGGLVISACAGGGGSLALNDSLNSLIERPKPLPRSGSRFGPKINRTMARITRRCIG